VEGGSAFVACDAPGDVALVCGEQSLKGNVAMRKAGEEIVGAIVSENADATLREVEQCVFFLDGGHIGQREDDAGAKQGGVKAD